MSIFRKYKEHLSDVLYIWRQEILQVFKDEGVLMFLVVVPLGYPLLYSWIYNNEALHETPVAVVNQSHSVLSRQFINDCDATPDVQVKYYAQDLDEARSLISRQLVRGIYPVGFRHPYQSWRTRCHQCLLRHVAHACLQGRLSDCHGGGSSSWCWHKNQKSRQLHQARGRHHRPATRRQ